MIRVRQGRFDEGKRILEAILEDPAVKPPLMSLLIVGQELREVAPVQPSGQVRLRAGDQGQ